MPTPPRGAVGRMLRGLVACAAGLWLTCGPTRPAFADTVSSLRSDLLVERAHDIQLTLHPGRAELVVRRTVFNGGPRHDEATFHIDLPEGAVATALRTLGSLRGKPHWFAGELLEAEAAAARYRELTGIGGYYPKDPALLSWRSQQLLALQVFPCPPGEDKSVEYTLSIPTHYRDGAHHLELPAFGTDTLTASIKARAANPRHRLLVGGSAPPAVIRPEPGGSLDFALVEDDVPPLRGELVASEFAPQRVLTRYAFHAAPRLSQVPRGAHLVLVLDASLSTDAGFIDRAKLALDAYLSHFDDAQVELVLFERRLQRSFGGFLPVAQARTALAALGVRRRNGSDVDRALAEADLILSRTPAGARRIVLLTDGLTRAGLTAERLRAATSRSSAVTHVGLLEDGHAELERDDEHPWARGLRPNAGIVWRARISSGGGSAARDVYEEWARPVRLHQVRLYTPELGLQSELEALPATLDEGQGLESLLLTEQRAPWLALEGELWTERVTRALAPDASAEARWSALVFGSPLVHSLSEPEMMTLAVRGGAVSPVTSYLAIEPGVRPSTEGLDWSGSGFGSGFGAGVRMGATKSAGRTPLIDRQGFLDQALSTEWRRCGGRPGEGSVTFETTSAEIVSIEPLQKGASDPLLQTCLHEAVWDLVLPVSFDEEWNSWTVHL